jgi:hypothetical protein
VEGEWEFEVEVIKNKVLKVDYYDTTNPMKPL